MKKLLLAMIMLFGAETFGVSLNTEVLINFPQEKIMSIDIEMCIQTVGFTNKESVLNQQLRLKSQPSTDEVEKLKTAFEGIVEVSTFLLIVSEAICSSEIDGLAAFSISDMPMKVLITRPLLPIYFDFVRKFNDTYIIKDEEEEWLETINEMEELNNEWDEQIRNLHLHKMHK